MKPRVMEERIEVPSLFAVSYYFEVLGESHTKRNLRRRPSPHHRLQFQHLLAIKLQHQLAGECLLLAKRRCATPWAKDKGWRCGAVSFGDRSHCV